MIARFIGADGSMGFRKGQTYLIKLEEQGNIVLMTSPKLCPYQSWDAFFRNWERVPYGQRV